MATAQEILEFARAYRPEPQHDSRGCYRQFYPAIDEFDAKGMTVPQMVTALSEAGLYEGEPKKLKEAIWYYLRRKKKRSEPRKVRSSSTE